MIIDITRLIGRAIKGYKPTGIDRVCIEYLYFLKEKIKTSIYFLNKLWIFNEKFSCVLIDKILAIYNKNCDKKDLIYLLILSPFYLTSAEKNEIFLNLSHSGGLDSLEYQKAIKKHNLKTIFMVHDLIPIEHPELVREGEKQKHEIRIKNILQFGDLIFTNSEQTKKNLINYAEKQQISIDKEKIVVNYLGVSTNFINLSSDVDFNYIKEKYGLNNKYFVIVSTIEPRKNHSVLFNAWKILYTLLGEKTPQLVLIGRRGWENEQIIDFLERSRISRFVKEINDCSDSELKTILKNSQALLMPSIDEGFGLPVLEAIWLDVIVVCSSIPTFIELFKDIPIYCHWADATDWVTVVLEIISNENQKNNLLQYQILKKERNINALVKYDWTRHFGVVNKQINKYLLKSYNNEDYAKRKAE